MAGSWLPDWRDAAAYRFERLDRAGFAWEWLRRDPAYREAALAAGAPGEPLGADAAALWGLVRFEPTELAAPEARPLWRASIDREVLVADVSRCAASEAGALCLSAFGELLTFVSGEGRCHALLSDGSRRLRIDLHGQFAPDEPVMPHWRIAGIAPGLQLRAIARLVSLAASHRFANRLWPHDPRTRRWILALRAHDALAAGEGHRALAELLGAEADTGRWRVREPSLRLQAQRLAALTRRLRGSAFAAHYLGGPECRRLAKPPLA